jgi:hypothetical protein
MAGTARLTLVALLLGGLAAQAQPTTCTQSPSQVSLTRQLRQAYLDLLGRPPTLAEYQFTIAKGAIGDDDLRELMQREDFYTRMKGYHRALLRANVVSSVYSNGDNRLNNSADNAKPLEFRGNPSSPLRGQNGAACNHLIDQDQCATQHEDPHLEGTRSSCRDERGVPLPVSVDYSPNQYTCTALTGATSCADAMTKGLVPAKHYFYCDMRLSGTALAPFYCLPAQTNPTTAAMTTEELDSSGRVIAFSNPTPMPGQLARLERCTTTLVPGTVRGRWGIQTGCVQREGYTTVPAPFFDTTGAVTVTMCAIEAQTRDVNPWTMESCESGRFTGDRSCGCGSRARRCEPGSGTLFTARINAMNEEPLLIADSVLRREEDYFNVLTTRRSFVNGTLSQLYRDAQSPTIWLTTPPTARDAVPNVPLTDTTTWAEYTRDENASGVLTTPAWLYRFPTRRSRVNQFYGAFLCKSFSPPADAVVPAPEDSCNRENNLAKRCGCAYCHATIEPTGAHWGRYGERNAQFLSADAFPKFSAKCRDCALNGDTTCDNQCGNYIMQAFDGEGASSLGLLNTYLYRTPDEEPNIVGGPKLLVERMMQTGDLERCAVKNAWNALVGRPMTTAEEAMYLESLVTAFAGGNHNFKSLMLQIMKTDAYRRVD